MNFNYFCSRPSWLRKELTFLFEYVSIRDCSTSVCFITSMVWVTSELFSSTTRLGESTILVREQLAMFISLGLLPVHRLDFPALPYFV